MKWNSDLKCIYWQEYLWSAFIKMHLSRIFRNTLSLSLSLSLSLAHSLPRPPLFHFFFILHSSSSSSSPSFPPLFSKSSVVTEISFSLSLFSRRKLFPSWEILASPSSPFLLPLLFPIFLPPLLYKGKEEEKSSSLPLALSLATEFPSRGEVGGKASRFFSLSLSCARTVFLFPLSFFSLLASPRDRNYFRHEVTARRTSLSLFFLSLFLPHLSSSSTLSPSPSLSRLSPSLPFHFFSSLFLPPLLFLPCFLHLLLSSIFLASRSSFLSLNHACGGDLFVPVFFATKRQETETREGRWEERGEMSEEKGVWREERD